jgi:hypothetical protein
VRDFSAAVATELGSLRRRLREDVAGYETKRTTLEAARETINEREQEMRETIELMANDAIDQLTMIEGIGLQTQDNRLRRIKKRKDEALARMDDLM